MTLPRLVFGTSCLGNLYAVVPDATKHAILTEIFRQWPAPVALDSAGKYGAGLALEVIGRALRQLNIPPANVILSNNSAGTASRCAASPLARTHNRFNDRLDGGP